MVFESIEELKLEYTDKYVVVDASRPELKRFQHLTGVVKTVNMNGRALVEFDGFENIGWYDIDVDFLKVVDKPLEVETPKKKAAKPSSKSAAKPAAAESAAKPAAKSAAKPAVPAGGAMSIADILAAARGGADAPKTDAPAAESKPAPKPETQPAAKPNTASSSQPKDDPASMSVADILAAARGGTPSENPQPVAEPEAAESEEAEEPVDEEPVDEEPIRKQTDEGNGVDDGPLPTSVEDIVAFCQQRDG